MQIFVLLQKKYLKILVKADIEARDNEMFKLFFIPFVNEKCWKVFPAM